MPIPTIQTNHQFVNVGYAFKLIPQYSNNLGFQIVQFCYV